MFVICDLCEFDRYEMKFVKAYTDFTKKGPEIKLEFDLSGLTREFLWLKHDPRYMLEPETNLWFNGQLTILERIVKEVDGKLKVENDNLHPTQQKHNLTMNSYSNGYFKQWHSLCGTMPDTLPGTQFNNKLAFASSIVNPEDYATFKLDYDIDMTGSCTTENYDKIINTLYDEEERRKIEWAIGSIIAGDSKDIQKFYVLYGDPGTGKSTILDIIESLFSDDKGNSYVTHIDVGRLCSSGDQFAIEQFKTNPMIGIEHDGDLSKINKNTTLNSIVSHETILVNEKGVSAYELNKPITTIFVGTNSPVKFTDAKSGLKRRLIDINPTGNRIPEDEFKARKKAMLSFERPGIAARCLAVYTKYGPRYYSSYEARNMEDETDYFRNFVQDNIVYMKNNDPTCVADLFNIYKEYCDATGVTYMKNMIEFKREIKFYYKEFRLQGYLDTGGEKKRHVRNYLSGFKEEEFLDIKLEEPDNKDIYIPEWLQFKPSTHSKLDDLLANDLAQYCKTGTDHPAEAWEYVRTHLRDLDSTKLHYVNYSDIHHIVIDFDIKENGEKSLEKNIKAASSWQPTYAELSRSGNGIHLHYIYEGDPLLLQALYDENIEIKVLPGKQSLRRMLSKCNDLDIATFNGLLPIKEKGDKVFDENVALNEHQISKTLKKCLLKSYGSKSTSENINTAKWTLDNAYNSGISYDMRMYMNDFVSFAQQSTHQAARCLEVVSKMHWTSKDIEEMGYPDGEEANAYDDSRPIVIFDIEVFPNLLMICWKYLGEDQPVNVMYNPTSEEVKKLIIMNRLVGYNNRGYDNHIIHARAYKGATLLKCFEMSDQIVHSKKGELISAKDPSAYSVSYTDIFDYSTVKQSLKKWEIQLHLPHEEFNGKWNEPLPESRWEECAHYCTNDVLATEAVWNATQKDFKARCMIAELAGMTPNDSTNTISTTIVFGKGNKKPWAEFNFPDLAEEFPGYRYLDKDGNDIPYNRIDGENYYKGTKVGKGGYVDAKHGTYENAWTFDVTSMHPSTIIELNMFGKYTARFKALVDLRKAIKHKDLELAKTFFDGKLAKYLEDPKEAKDLAYALKMVINPFYGLTSAQFENPARDPRNGINIVALRGALMIMSLRDALEEAGYSWFHIKTDSIKVIMPEDPVETEKLYNFIMDFGAKYGYGFEVEHKFKRICLANNAVYIAQVTEDDDEYEETVNGWVATGAQFAEPYVFKTMFTGEELDIYDYEQTKSVDRNKFTMYLDLNEQLPEGEHNLYFIGNVGSFIPVYKNCGGGDCVAVADADGSTRYVTGTKGYKWMETSAVVANGKQNCIDINYYNELVKDAAKQIKDHDENGVFSDITEQFFM